MSTHHDCLAQVQTDIQGLNLTDVKDESIVVKKLPLERVKRNDNLSWPIILITPARPSVLSTGTNCQDDVVQPVLVTLIDQDQMEKTLEKNLTKYMDWLQSIRKQFHCKNLTGVSAVYTCTVEPADVVLPQAWQANLWASALLLKFISRELR